MCCLQISVVLMTRQNSLYSSQVLILFSPVSTEQCDSIAGVHRPAQEQLTCFSSIPSSHHHQVTSHSKWKPGVPGALHGHESKPYLCSQPLGLMPLYNPARDQVSCKQNVFMFTESLSSGSWSILFHYLWKSNSMRMPPGREAANIKVFHSFVFSFLHYAHSRNLAFLIIFLPP